MSSTEQLLKTIGSVQERYGLSDRQFSLKIGVDPSLWSLVKRGIRPPGMKFLNGIVNQYPETKQAVYEYIGSAGEKVA